MHHITMEHGGCQTGRAKPRLQSGGEVWYTISSGIFTTALQADTPLGPKALGRVVFLGMIPQYLVDKTKHLNIIKDTTRL